MVNAYYSLTDTAAPIDARDPFYWPKNAATVSTDHPYAANANQSWTVGVQGAARIAIHFSKFDTEQNFDTVT